MFRISQLRINATFGVINAGTSLVLQLLVIRIVVPIIGYDLYGLWATLSLIMLFGQISNQGIMDSVVRNISKSHAQEQKDAKFQYFFSAIIISVVIGCVFCFTTIFIKEFAIIFLKIPEEFNKIAQNSLIMLSVFPLLLLVGNTCAATLTGIGRYDLTNKVQIFSQIFRFITIFYLAQNQLGIWAFVFGNATFFIINILLMFHLLYRFGLFKETPKKFFLKKRISETIYMGQHLFYTQLIMTGSMGIFRATITRHLGLEAAGFFAIAFKLIFALRNILNSALKALLPRISELTHSVEDGHSHASALVSRCMKQLLAALFPISLIAYVFSFFFIQLLVGEELAIAITTIFRIFIVGYFFNLLVIPPYLAIIAWGKTLYIFLISLLSTCTLGLCLLFATRSVEAYTFSYTGSLLIGAASVVFFYRKTLNEVKDIKLL